MKWGIVFTIAIVFGIGIGLSLNVSAEEGLIPSWIRNSVGFWIDGVVSDREFLNAMSWLIDEGVMEVSATSNQLSTYVVENSGNVGKGSSSDPESTKSVSCNNGDLPLSYGAFGVARESNAVLWLTTSATPHSNGFDIQVINHHPFEGGKVTFWATCLEQ